MLKIVNILTSAALTDNINFSQHHLFATRKVNLFYNFTYNYIYFLFSLQLLHKIIDGLCGQAYPLYQDYHSVWDSAEWNHVLEDITKFFKAVVGKNLSDEEVTALQISVPCNKKISN